MSDWFTIDTVDENTDIISEYRHWEEPHCYLLNGAERSLLIDTGLGICNIYHEVIKLSGKPVTAVATHIHWDHIGGHGYFPDFYAHADELDWLGGKFPLPRKVVQDMVVDRCDLPEGFDVGSYTVFQGTPTRVLRDCDTIDLGGRVVEVLHTPGHSPGHMCFWEEAKGYLFTGDLVYLGALLADFPSTDPEAYLASLKKISALPVKRVFPGHHSLRVAPGVIAQMRDAFVALQAKGLLRHGAGTFRYGGWAVRL